MLGKLKSAFKDLKMEIIMKNWNLEKLNKSVKKLDFVDFKLSQLSSFAFALMIVKIFPFLRRLGFKKLLSLLVLSGFRPFCKFFPLNELHSQEIDEESPEEQ